MRRLLLASSVLLLAGCPWPWAPAPTPSPTVVPTIQPTLAPTPQGLPIAASVFVNGLAIVGGVINVRVEDAAHARVGGAIVSLLGATPGHGTTNGADDLQFSPLEGGSYSLLVSAPGYATQLLSGLTLDPKTPLGATLTLAPHGGAVSGRVVNAGGGGLPGVRVCSGPVGTFTGADGSFSLVGLGAGTHTVTMSKTGMAGASQTVVLSGADVAAGTWSMAPQTPIVSFENAAQAFGTSTVAQVLQPLRTALNDSGFTVADGNANATVRVVASPTLAAADDATVERLRAFVAAGGKLILMGEWGGAFNYTPEALNRLARPYGFAFNSDLVRSSTNAGQLEWVRVPTLDGNLPVQWAMPSGITLFDACSIYAPPPCVTVAGSGTGGYRVASLDSIPLVGVARIYGQGLVIALGDTSAWASGSTTANQPTGGNLAETNNREFVLNLFSW